MAELSRHLEKAVRGVDDASAFLGRFRWAFVPLGLVALLACGVHAGADVLDDRFLWCVDHVDTFFDGLFSRFTWTRSWVDVVGLEQRLWVARTLALLWELAVDVILVVPAIGYQERKPERASLAEQGRALGRIFQRTVQRPTTLRILRPLATAAVALAGACAVAKGVQTAFFQSTHGLLGFGLAASLGRFLAVGVLAGVLISLGGRAVLRNAQHADALSERKRLRLWDLAFTRGLWASLLVAPLALAALLGASPVMSFFR